MPLSGRVGVGSSKGLNLIAPPIIANSSSLRFSRSEADVTEELYEYSTPSLPVRIKSSAVLRPEAYFSVNMLMIEESSSLPFVALTV